MAPAPSPAPPRWRARLLPAFVLYHLLAVTLLSMPAPFGAKSASVWQEPHTRAQIEGWLKPLRALGVDLSTAEVLPTIQRASVVLLTVRTTLVAPFRPYAKLVGAGQGWQMFATLNEEPARLEIDRRTAPDAPWIPLYKARDPAYSWRVELLDEERTRTVINDWSWSRNKAAYLRFGERIAREVVADFPDTTEVRLVMLRRKIPEPDDLAAGRAAPERETWEQIVPVEKTP